MKIFSERMREMRGRQSQVSSARLVGISQQAWAKYETNSTSPTAESVAKLALAFNVSADWLLGLSDRREGGITIVQDPKMLEENNILKANIVTLQAELHRLQGEISGLNKALELMSKK